MLELETGLFFWTVISFGILVVLLYRVALPPLLAFLAQREKMIADAISEAAENQQRSEELLNKHKKQLAELHQSADKIIDQAREEAHSARAEIISKADRQADIIMEKTRVEIAREKDKILQTVKGEVAEMVITAAGKILKREVTDKDNLRIIEESLRQNQ
jgi:F-type H+-transporting ATPase subunit b